MMHDIYKRSITEKYTKITSKHIDTWLTNKQIGYWQIYRHNSDKHMGKQIIDKLTARLLKKIIKYRLTLA